MNHARNHTTQQAPKKPTAGDERTIGGVRHIRQQKIIHDPLHGPMHVTNNGKPAWEWVAKGSDRDRIARREPLTTYTLVINGTGACPLTKAHIQSMRDSWHDTLTKDIGRGVQPFEPEVTCEDHGEASALLTFKAPAKLVEPLIANGIRIQVKS